MLTLISSWVCARSFIYAYAQCGHTWISTGCIGCDDDVLKCLHSRTDFMTNWFPFDKLHWLARFFFQMDLYPYSICIVRYFIWCRCLLFIDSNHSSFPKMSLNDTRKKCFWMIPAVHRAQAIVHAMTFCYTHICSTVISNQTQYLLLATVRRNEIARALVINETYVNL